MEADQVVEFSILALNFALFLSPQCHCHVNTQVGGATVCLFGSGHALCHTLSYLTDAVENVREEGGTVVMVSGCDGSTRGEETVRER